MPLGDFPDYMVRIQPTDVIEVDETYAVPFVMKSSATVAAGVLQQFDFEFTDENYIYQVCYVHISPNLVKEHVDYIDLFGGPSMAGAGNGGVSYPLYENPSALYISGDTLTVKVRNADSSSRVIVVIIAGTRYLRPAGWIHPPFVRFHASPLTPNPGEDVQFTDDSLYTPDKWLWDFGDNETSEQQNPIHSYDAEGDYDVSLFASNAAGFDKYIKYDYISICSYEDPSTYTCYDCSTYITWSGYQVNVVSIQANADRYLYKDFGTDYFNDVKIRFTANLTAYSNAGIAAFIVLGNAIDDANSMTGKHLCIRIQAPSGENPQFYLEYRDGASEASSDYYVVSAGTEYYFELQRSAGSNVTTLKIYSDVNYTNLLDTLTVDAAGFSLKWRYLYLANTYNIGWTNSISGYIKNVNILSH